LARPIPSENPEVQTTKPPRFCLDYLKTLFQIGASYRFERDPNIAPQSSLCHSCASEEVGVNKQRGTTEEIHCYLIQGVVEGSRQTSVKMNLTGRKLKNYVNYKSHVKEKMNKLIGYETWSMCVLTFTFTSFSEEEVMSIERLFLAISHEILRKRPEKSSFLQFMTKRIVSTTAVNKSQYSKEQQFSTA